MNDEGTENISIGYLQRKLEEANNEMKRRKTGGSDGTSSGSDDGRLDKIETRLGAIEGEQRIFDVSR